MNRSCNPLLPEPFYIIRAKRESSDVFSLWLNPQKNLEKSSAILNVSPGQFNMLYAFGIGEVPISISGIQTGAFMHTIRAVGPVTQALKKLKAGATVGVRGPFGSSWPLDKAQGLDVVILAGGIGLAPLRQTLFDLLFGAVRPRKVVLVYGTRTPKDIIFFRELQQWQKRWGLELYITVDRPVSGWAGHVGIVPELISKLKFQPEKSLAMICGPEVMMRFSIQELKKRSLKDDAIYLSMERNMKCAVGFCGRCQFVPYFVCKDGPVFSYDRVQPFFGRKEI